MSSFDHLISGYFRNATTEEDFFMNVPKEMEQVISHFYPKLMSFTLYNSKHFTVKQKGKYIQGKGVSCNAFFVYVGHDTFMVDGFSEGTHCLSVRNLNHEGSGQCIHSIGVISEKKSEYTLDTDHEYVYCQFHPGSVDADCSFFTGFPDYWVNGEVMTVILDCNRSIVTYYKDGDKVQENGIKSGVKYFFALHLCSSDDIKMEIVDYTITEKESMISAESADFY